MRKRIKRQIQKMLLRKVIQEEDFGKEIEELTDEQKDKIHRQIDKIFKEVNKNDGPESMAEGY